MIRDRDVFVPAKHTDAFAAEPQVNATEQIARLSGEYGTHNFLIRGQFVPRLACDIHGVGTNRSYMVRDSSRRR